MSDARVLTLAEQLEMKQDDYEAWFTHAKNALSASQLLHKADFLLEPAFLLHQSAEKAITALLLVYTGYKSKTHDLKILREKIQALEGSFTQRFDLEDKNESYHFDLIKRAYIESRYNKGYAITKDELTTLEEKIIWLHHLVEKHCEQEIAKLKE